MNGERAMSDESNCQAGIEMQCGLGLVWPGLD